MNALLGGYRRAAGQLVFYAAKRGEPVRARHRRARRSQVRAAGTAAPVYASMHTTTVSGSTPS
jgi:hypothetical protein